MDGWMGVEVQLVHWLQPPCGKKIPTMYTVIPVPLAPSAALELNSNDPPHKSKGTDLRRRTFGSWGCQNDLNNCIRIL